MSAAIRLVVHAGADRDATTTPVPANEVELFECQECLGTFVDADFAPRGTYDVCANCLPGVEQREERRRHREDGCAGCGCQNCVCCIVDERRSLDAEGVRW